MARAATCTHMHGHRLPVGKAAALVPRKRETSRQPVSAGRHEGTGKRRKGTSDRASICTSDYTYPLLTQSIRIPSVQQPHSLPPCHRITNSRSDALLGLRPRTWLVNSMIESSAVLRHVLGSIRKENAHGHTDSHSGMRVVAGGCRADRPGRKARRMTDGVGTTRKPVAPGR